jgi:DUF2889 family protein
VPHRVIRASVLDVTPRRPLSFAAGITGRAVDTIEAAGTGDAEVIRTAEVQLTLDEDMRIAAFSSSAGDLGLVGQSAGRGFRAALEPLRAAGAEQRLLARLLWDVPMFAQVAGQTALLDHDRARADLTLSRRGTDQCSGWRADGQMMQQVDGNGGVLVMPLGPERTTPSIAEPWLPGLGLPTPMATRRSRVLRVGARLPTGAYPVGVGFRDSYADPDAVHRALHEWDVHTEYGSDGRFGAVSVDAGRLPWVECPVAGLSAGRLNGATPAEVDEALGSGFGGISTCTHLNDTLRSLVDITDLTAALA